MRLNNFDMLSRQLFVQLHNLVVQLYHYTACRCTCPTCPRSSAPYLFVYTTCWCSFSPMTPILWIYNMGCVFTWLCIQVWHVVNLPNLHVQPIKFITMVVSIHVFIEIYMCIFYVLLTAFVTVMQYQHVFQSKFFFLYPTPPLSSL